MPPHMRGFMHVYASLTDLKHPRRFSSPVQLLTSYQIQKLLAITVRLVLGSERTHKGTVPYAAST